MSVNSPNGEQADPVYYVWSEYALSLRPCELANMLSNPQVRSATSKTRCNVEVTRRVLNRRELASQWARYSIVRITGPDDQSISQCNRLLERAVPVYQQRREYPRRAPVTYYLKNVDDFGVRSGDAALAALITKNRDGLPSDSKRRSSSESEAARGLTVPMKKTSRSDANSRSGHDLDPMGPVSYKLTDAESSMKMKAPVGVTVTGGQPPPLITKTEGQVRIETMVKIEPKTEDGNVMSLTPLKVDRNVTPMVKNSVPGTVGTGKPVLSSGISCIKGSPDGGLPVVQPEAGLPPDVHPVRPGERERDLTNDTDKSSFTRVQSDAPIALNQTQSTPGSPGSRGGTVYEKQHGQAVNDASEISPGDATGVDASYGVADQNTTTDGQLNPSKTEQPNSTSATLAMKASCVSDGGESALFELGITTSQKVPCESPTVVQDPAVELSVEPKNLVGTPKMGFTTDQNPRNSMRAVEATKFPSKTPGTKRKVAPSEVDLPPTGSLCSPPQSDVIRNEALTTPLGTSDVDGGISSRELSRSPNRNEIAGGRQIFVSDKITLEHPTGKVELVSNVSEVDGTKSSLGLHASLTSADDAQILIAVSEERGPVAAREPTDRDQSRDGNLPICLGSQKEQNIPPSDQSDKKQRDILSGEMLGSQGNVVPSGVDLPPTGSLCSPPQSDVIRNEALTTPLGTSDVDGGISSRELSRSPNRNEIAGGRQIFVSDKITLEHPTGKVELKQRDILSGEMLGSQGNVVPSGVDLPPTGSLCSPPQSDVIRNEALTTPLGTSDVDGGISSRELSRSPNRNEIAGGRQIFVSDKITLEHPTGKVELVSNVSEVDGTKSSLGLHASLTSADDAQILIAVSEERGPVAARELTDRDQSRDGNLTTRSMLRDAQNVASADASDGKCQNISMNGLAASEVTPSLKNGVVPQSLSASSTAMVNFSLRQQITVLDSEQAYDLTRGGGIKPLTDAITSGVPATEGNVYVKEGADVTDQVNTHVGEQYTALTQSAITGLEVPPNVKPQLQASFSYPAESNKDLPLLTPQQLLLSEPDSSSDLGHLGSGQSQRRISPSASTTGHRSFPDDSVTPTLAASQQLKSGHAWDLNDLVNQEPAHAILGAQKMFEGSGVPEGPGVYENQTSVAIGEQQQRGLRAVGPAWPVRGVDDRASPGAILSGPTPPPPLSMPSSTPKRLSSTVGQQVFMREPSTVAPSECAVVSPDSVMTVGAPPPVAVSGCPTSTTGEGTISFKLMPNQDFQHVPEIPKPDLSSGMMPRAYVAIRTSVEQNKPEDKPPTAFMDLGYDLVTDGRVVLSVDGSLPQVLDFTVPVKGTVLPPLIQGADRFNHQKESYPSSPAAGTAGGRPPPLFTGTTCFTEDVHVLSGSSSASVSPVCRFEVDSRAEIQSMPGFDEQNQPAQSPVLEQSPRNSPFDQIHIEKHIDITTKDPSGSGKTSFGECAMGSPGVKAVGANVATLPQLDQAEFPGSTFNLSPLSVTASISTNLEVHVNRDTGKIDVSFEISGTPAPTGSGGVSSNVPDDQGMSAEWCVKVQQNALFGAIGAMPPWPESAESDVAPTSQ
ncbi:hypothetical protein FBUS_06623 [Fasciolopsis buskii]|uniref:Uncharacterized protein n=1 Tax=Fasciolopsis buskii TaxID=27845 RepID=A0A8E0VKC8_9TREM|nr:hypothetical protein FBUS_06623 [Fasciolopsis buski]